jgi:hypothetical protein
VLKRDIDLIAERLFADIPGIRIDQLKVKYPGDDDGLWFIDIPSEKATVQIESSNGNCPFLIESDFNNDRVYGRSIEETVRAVKNLFSLA